MFAQDRLWWGALTGLLVSLTILACNPPGEDFFETDGEGSEETFSDETGLVDVTVGTLDGSQLPAVTCTVSLEETTVDSRPGWQVLPPEDPAIINLHLATVDGEPTLGTQDLRVVLVTDPLVVINSGIDWNLPTSLVVSDLATGNTVEERSEFTIRDDGQIEFSIVLDEQFLPDSATIDLETFIARPDDFLGTAYALTPITSPDQLEGPEGGNGFAGVRVLQYDNFLGELGTAVFLLGNPEFASDVIDTVAVTINAEDEQTNFGNQGVCEPIEALPADTPGDDTDRVFLYKFTLEVPEAGYYTFNIHSDDGMALRIGDQVPEIVTGVGAQTGAWVYYSYGTCDSSTRAAYYLPEGEHQSMFITFELGGGSFHQLLSAPGIHLTDESTREWRPVGHEATGETLHILGREDFVEVEAYAMTDGTPITSPLQGLNALNAGLLTTTHTTTSTTIFHNDPDDLQLQGFTCQPTTNALPGTDDGADNFGGFYRFTVFINPPADAPPDHRYELWFDTDSTFLVGLDGAGARFDPVFSAGGHVFLANGNDGTNNVMVFDVNVPGTNTLALATLPSESHRLSLFLADDFVGGMHAKVWQGRGAQRQLLFAGTGTTTSTPDIPGLRFIDPPASEKSSFAIPVESGGTATTALDFGDLTLDFAPGTLPGGAGDRVVVSVQPSTVIDPLASYTIEAGEGTGGLVSPFGAVDLEPGIVFEDNGAGIVYVVPRVGLTLNGNLVRLGQVGRYNPATGAWAAFPTGVVVDAVSATFTCGGVSGFSTWALLFPLDSDDDGVPDSFPPLEDLCPDSIVTPTVDVGPCVIENRVDEDGCTLADRVASGEDLSELCNTEPPICDAGGPYSVACGGDTTELVLDGSGSSDPDSPTIGFSWSTDCPGASFDDASSATPVLSLDTSRLGAPLECSVTLTVSDGDLEASCDALILVSPCEICDDELDNDDDGLTDCDDLDCLGRGGCPACRVDIVGPTSAATERSVELGAQVSGTEAPVGYAWAILDGPGSIVGAADAATVTVRCDQEGAVTVRLVIESAACGSVEDTHVVTCGPCEETPDAVTIGGPSEAEEGQEVTLSADATGVDGAVTWSWTVLDGPGTIVGADDEPSVSVRCDGPGTVRVLVSVEDELCGNQVSATKEITCTPCQEEPDEVSIDGPIELAVGSEATLNARVAGVDDGGAVTYEWELVDGPASLLGALDGPIVALRCDGTGTTIVELRVADGICENIAVARLTIECSPSAGGLQHPGDCNQDGNVDISDAICLFGFLFLGAPTSLPCGDGTVGDRPNVLLIDANGDTGVDLSDGVFVLSYLFGSCGGGPPCPTHVLGEECVRIEGCPEVCSP